MSISATTISGFSTLIYAISYAAEKHDGFHRKNSKKQPYITHPLSVLNFVVASGVSDPDVLCAAVLHDVVEDTSATIKDIRAHFGEKVASIVAEVTDDRTLSQLERKKAQLEHTKTLSREAAHVKLADALDNLSSLCVDPPMGWSVEKIQGCAAASANALGRLAQEKRRASVSRHRPAAR